jgi:DNA-binding NarL/FixJ family response regulator
LNGDDRALQHLRVRWRVWLVSASVVEAILIADDHPLFRAALKQLLAVDYPQTTVVEAADIPQVQRCVSQQPGIAMVLLDLHMPGAHGFSALSFLTGNYPHIPVVIVSANTHPQTVRRAVDFGAAGFLGKSTGIDEMRATLARVLGGEIVIPEGLQATGGVDLSALDVAAAVSRLTPQQYRVASMLVEGLLNKQIAYELQVTEATIKAHMTEVFKKLGVHSRTQAVLALHALAVEAPAELISPPAPD